jgi:hypothetical protein
MLSATRKRLGRAILLLGLFALIGGCGGKQTSDVSGTVTFKGKPLEFGSVNVIASDDKAYMGEIQSDGKYSIKKVPVGSAKVCVECTDPKIREEVNAMLKESKRPTADKGQAKPNIDPRKLNVIPEAYSDPSKSGLRVEVKAPTTTYDIPLDEKGPK